MESGRRAGPARMTCYGGRRADSDGHEGGADAEVRAVGGVVVNRRALVSDTLGEDHVCVGSLIYSDI